VPALRKKMRYHNIHVTAAAPTKFACVVKLQIIQVRPDQVPRPSHSPWRSTQNSLSSQSYLALNSDRTPSHWPRKLYGPPHHCTPTCEARPPQKKTATDDLFSLETSQGRPGSCPSTAVQHRHICRSAYLRDDREK
jgi:hypothetical protein